MIKNLLLASHTGQALFLSDTYEGSVHDKAIADVTPYPFIHIPHISPFPLLLCITTVILTILA